MSTTATKNQLLERLAPYFQECLSACPYGLPGPALYQVAAFSRIPEKLMELLLAAGFRRNGNNVYAMRCPNCRGCRPIRLAVRQFEPNRSQKRTKRRNRDVFFEQTPLSPDPEKIALLDKFFRRRFPGRHNSAIDYYAGFFLNSSDFSMEINYLCDGKLLGSSIVDVGSSWLNAVYFFFDPDEARRSLGTFNILHLIDFCRQHGLEHLYLGFTIAEVQAMRYKTAFLPHQIMEKGGWVTFGTSGGHTPDRP